jgi:cytochrome c oxidase subunit 2
MPIDIDNGRTGRRAFVGAVGGLVLGSVAGWPGRAAAARHRGGREEVRVRPGEIQVRRGEPVTLQFTAPEVPMGFNLADFNLRADIVPGKVTTMQLTADKTGTFTFLCDVFCGTGHEDMSGTLVVT